MENKRPIIIGILLIVTMFAGVAMFASAIYTYNTQGYPIYEAQTWINNAESTTDYTVMAHDLQEAQALLAPYHGNPYWFYPTPATTWSVLKDQLNGTIQQLLQPNNATQGNQLVLIQQQLNNINAQLSNDVSSIVLNGAVSIGIVFYIIFGVVGPILMWDLEYEIPGHSHFFGIFVLAEGMVIASGIALAAIIP